MSARKPAPPPSPAPKKEPDWQAIELDYRSGVKTVRLIGEQHGVSHVSILKRAKKEEWPRDLSAKVKAREDELVATKLVTKMVTNAEKVTERVHIEALAKTNANIRTSLMDRHARQERILNGLMGDLETISNPEGQGLVESLMDVLRTPDQDESEEQARKRRADQLKALDRATSIDNRVEIFKSVMTAEEKLTRMQREDYGITDKTPLEEQAGKVLNDAERASRASAILTLALQRRAEDQLRTTDAA